MHEVDEEKLIENIEDFIMLGEPSKFPQEHYVINDSSEYPFFHKNYLQDVLISRIDSYYNATLLLLHFLALGRENSSYDRDITIENVHEFFKETRCEIRDPQKRAHFSLKSKLSSKLIGEILKKYAGCLTDNETYGCFYNKNKQDRWGNKKWFNQLDKAEALSNWIRPVKTVITVSKYVIKHDGYTIVQYDLPILTKTESQLREFRLETLGYLNHWFSNLEEWEQAFFKACKRQIESEQASLPNIAFTHPSTIRVYPTLPFYMHHGVLFFNKDKRLIHQKSRPRASLVTPYMLEGGGEVPFSKTKFRTIYL